MLMNSLEGTGEVVSSADLATSAVEYSEASDTYRTEYSTITRPASQAVVAAVEVATGRDPLDLPTLYSVFDPDALDDLFAPTAAGHSRHGGSITFEYADQQVTVESNGIVKVQPASSA